MSQPKELPEHWKQLIDDYLDGVLDEGGMQDLESHLRAEPDARRYFVRYARLHTDLHLEARARDAARRALERLEQMGEAASEVSQNVLSEPECSRPGLNRAATSIRWFTAKRLAIAAGLLLAVVTTVWLVRGRFSPSRVEEESAIAWLVNAQDCTWSESGPTGNLQAGTVLKIDRGLAEIRFQCGAHVILEGPCQAELKSGRIARLVSGKLTARVPAEATGFEVQSPHGTVVDLGTEFGVRSDQGLTEVYVFKGKVEAHPRATPNAPAQPVTEHHAAQITSGAVRPIPAEDAEGRFVRTIMPPPVVVPRTLRLTFNQANDGTIKDRFGLGIGLTYRLPGTGNLFPDRDSNLRLHREKSQLELTTTNSDLNTQYKLGQGEYFGVRLADLGFTGKEDFAAAVTIPNIPALEVVGQFGLYAGTRSDRSIRGGLIGHMEPGQYTQFLVNNDKGNDTPDICKVGLLSTGTDLRLTFKRVGGKYSLTVENLTEGSTSALTVRHPDFLDGAKDLYVGLFGANTQSEVRKTLVFKDFQATVWTVVPPAVR